MKHWDALGTSAQGITGDIELSPSRIVFENGSVLALIYVGSAPDIMLDAGPRGTTAQIYRVMIPQNPLLLHGNRLCNEPATYVAWIELPFNPFDGLRLDIITGRQPPRSGMRQDRVCSRFSFTREAGKH
jgi:hypothetical protein